VLLPSAGVLNDEAEFQQAYDAGADGVMTDAPAKLVAYLKQRDAETNKEQRDTAAAQNDSKTQ
jgi:hypothetical protein